MGPPLGTLGREGAAAEAAPIAAAVTAMDPRRMCDDTNDRPTPLGVAEEVGDDDGGDDSASETMSRDRPRASAEDDEADVEAAGAAADATSRA